MIVEMGGETGGETGGGMLAPCAGMPHVGAMTQLAHLPGRDVVRVSGADRVGFLNGLVSNDVALVAPGVAVWAALLSPQGKYLADFFILTDGDQLLLDCDAAQSGLVAQRLARFRLRADVAIAAGGHAVYAAWDGAPPDGGVVAADPRLPEAGFRVLITSELPTNADAADWDAHRLRLGLPDGPRDMEADKSVLLEAGFDELNGISWTKGCYMGQELTARTRYRGLIKRRLLMVSAEADLPPPGTPVMAGEREVGTMRSSQGRIGLALMRLDGLAGAISSGGIAAQVEVPLWARLPGSEAI